MSVRDFWPQKYHDVAESEQYPECGRAKTPERHLKFTQRVRGQVRLNGEQEKRDQQSRRDHEGHETGEPKSSHQGDRPDAVENMVHIKAVAWTLLVPDPRQRSVKAIA